MRTGMGFQMEFDTQPESQAQAVVTSHHLESWVMLYNTHWWYIAMTPYYTAKGGILYDTSSYKGCYITGCYILCYAKVISRAHLEM